MGYCTLSKKGLILEANHTAADLLGVAKHALIKQPLTRFILPEDQDIWYRHHRCLYPQSCQLRMRGKDGALFWAHLATNLARKDDPHAPVGHVVLTDITEHRRMEDVLNFLAQYDVSSRAPGFFESLAAYLGEKLEMDFVCIDRLGARGLIAQTVAVWCDGGFEDNVAYALKGTPGPEVVGKSACVFPPDVCRLFPRDETLRKLRAESYIGVTLRSHTGQPIGLIAVIGRRPLTSRAAAEALLKTVAVRTGAELERLAVEEALLKAHDELEERMSARTDELMTALKALKEEKERFRTVADVTNDWETWIGPDGQYIYVSPSCRHISGYPPGDFYEDPSLMEKIVHP